MLDGHNILLVDEDEGFRTICGDLLEDAGCEVIHATDGRAALTLARQRTPDAILLDVMMSDMDGFDVLERLRAEPASRSIPIFMLSSARMSRHVLRAFQGGADDFICKPFDSDELLARLDAATARARRGPRARPATTGGPHEILLIDDDAHVVRMCRKILESSGYAVREARDGDTAMAEARQRAPSAILLDIFLPGTWGMQVLQALRAAPETASTPIFMLTAVGRSDALVEAFQSGADDYIRKPFDIMELTARLQRAIEREGQPQGRMAS